MATEVREHEERSHSARILVLLFLLCVAVCAVFFSMGFIVGRNERLFQSAPTTEVVTPPPAIPPTVNPPPDSTSLTPPAAPGGGPPANPAPDTEVIPPGGAGSVTPPAVAKPAEVAPPSAPTPATPIPASNPPTAPAPAAGSVGEGITLQVSAGRNKQDSENVVNILKEKGYPVFLATPEYTRADDNLFRVLVGPFRTRADADVARDKLVKEGFKPFIRH